MISTDIEEKYDFGQVDSLIENDVANGFPGAVLHVSYQGRAVKHSAYGYKFRYDNNYKQLPNPERMTIDTVFDLASNTKIFATAFTIMRMIEKGLLTLDRPLVDYMPGFESHNKITARMLLSHCAGYGPEILFFDKNNPHGKEFYSQNRELTKKLLFKVPLEYTPGSATVYSDTGFMLLGSIIEYLSGKSISETAKEFIYGPLGLKSTTFLPLKNGFNRSSIAATSIGNTCNGTMDYSNIRTNLIRGEVHDEKAYYCMDGMAGHAGLFSCSGEILRMCDLIHEVYNGKGIDLLFSKNGFSEFIKPVGPDNSFGCGWRINAQKKYSYLIGNRPPEKSIGHSGFTGTLSLIDLENHLSLVLLTNKVHSRCFDRKRYAGSDFATGKYAPVVDAVYECLNL